MLPPIQLNSNMAQMAADPTVSESINKSSLDCFDKASMMLSSEARDSQFFLYLGPGFGSTVHADR